MTHVDGQTALAYVRARHLDARADLGRIDRQQRFLGSMAARVTSRDVLLDPRALVRFLNAALDAVRADPGLTEKGLVTLGTELRHASGKDVRFRTVPIANPSYRVRGAGAVALWDDAAAKTLFTAMREDTSVRHAAKKGGAAASGDAVTSPMQGTIVKVAVEEGQTVAEGDVVVVLEAMKMEQPLKAHKSGTITGLDAVVGATVSSGAVLCEIK